MVAGAVKVLLRCRKGAIVAFSSNKRLVTPTTSSVRQRALSQSDSS